MVDLNEFDVDEDVDVVLVDVVLVDVVVGLVDDIIEVIAAVVDDDVVTGRDGVGRLVGEGVLHFSSLP